MLILGIDPGTATTGYGLISASNKGFEALDFGLIETDKEGDFGKRLIKIHKQLNDILKKLNPDVIAMEKLFFATNVKTATNVGRAMGVIILTCAKRKIEVIEYAPGTIKKQITGNGRADKKDIQKSLRKIFGAKIRSRVHKKTHFDNSADALAVALCHAYNVYKVDKRG
ncbi:MAG: crossover junction endodeoxyribonuclease RuvC [Patescibacteria group bacterium]